MLETEITKNRSGTVYDPRVTTQNRRETISSVVGGYLNLMEKSKKVKLADTEQVKQRSLDYLRMCESEGLLPNIEGLCAFFQINRQWFYEFLTKNPTSETTDFLKSLQTGMAACRINAVERGGSGEGLAIFLLKNSNLGFVDRSEIAAVDNRVPYQNSSESERAQKYLDGIVEDD